MVLYKRILWHLGSAKEKPRQNGVPFYGLPNDRTNTLWVEIRADCGLALVEISFSKNGVTGAVWSRIVESAYYDKTSKNLNFVQTHEHAIYETGGQMPI